MCSLQGHIKNVSVDLSGDIQIQLFRLATCKAVWEEDLLKLTCHIHSRGLPGEFRNDKASGPILIYNIRIN